MSDRTVEDLRDAMRQIAKELHGIDTTDCTRNEHNDEVSGWTEYVRT